MNETGCRRCKSPRATGEYAVKGSDYCHAHGGKTAVGAAQLMAWIREARVADPVRSPPEELHAHAERCAAYRDALAAMVVRLATAMETGDVADWALLRQELGHLERAIDRCTDALVLIARLEIRDRLARLEAAGEDVRHLFGNPGDDGDDG